MPFSDTWDAAYEAIPADTENINLGAGRIRDLKRDIQERVAADHSFAGDANDGLHLHVELIPQGFPSPIDAGHGLLYTTTVAGVVELVYKDTAGHTRQITSNGALVLGDAIANSLAIGSTLTVGTDGNVGRDWGVTRDSYVGRDLDVTGMLAVDGGVTLGTTLTVIGSSSLANLGVNGVLTVTGQADFAGEVNVTSGDLEVIAASGDARVTVNALAGESAWVQCDAGSAQRWLFGRNDTAESGANSGSDFDVVAFADDGTTPLSIPMSIRRSDGVIVMSALPTSAAGLPTGALWNNSGVLSVA